MDSWYCVQTYPNHEREAAQAIERLGAGFETFFPTFVVKDKQRNLHVRALFSGYVLVQLPEPEAWPRAAHAEYVRKLITYQQPVTEDNPYPYAYPLPCADRSIASLHAQSIEECTLRNRHRHASQRPDNVIQPGCLVNILRGPFQGMHAICEWVDQQRIKLLISIFGRETSAEFFCRDCALAV